MNGVFEHLDEAVQRLHGLRDELLADERAPGRSARLAAVFATEAEAWSQLYELSTLRLVWRAALGAEAGARLNAALWAHRAAAEDAQRERAGIAPLQSWATGRVDAPRPAALTNSSVGGGR